MIDVTLRLESEEALQQLLAGRYVLRLWLVEREPGVYRINTYEAEDANEAMVRATLAHVPHGDAPPEPEPSEWMAEQTSRWDRLFEELAHAADERGDEGP